MIAVADNGASKCEWMIGDESGEPVKVVHPGYNPNSATSLQEKAFVNDITRKVDAAPDRLFFYSAGMGNEFARTKMQSILESRFPGADIHIETDLTGTGRAMFGDQPGVAAILGTGANAGFYDGKTISHQPLSLGFLLGDEGSGAYFGKKLLQHYLREDLPVDIMQALEKSIAEPRHKLLQRFYSQPSPRVFTGMLQALEPMKEHPFLKQMIRTGFRLFFDRIVARVKCQEVNTIGFTGSVAHHFSKDLGMVADSKGFKICKILQHPAKALFEYHRSTIEI